MRGVALVLLFALLGAAATAQQITVRSGEHGEFTRLVLTIPEASDWSIVDGADSRSKKVKFATGGKTFDTSEVFQRINRNRISDLSVSEAGAALTIKLACTCSVSAFLMQSTLLVIDVKPGGAPGQVISRPKPVARPAIAQPGGQFSEVKVGPWPRIGLPKKGSSLLPALDLPAEPTDLEDLTRSSDLEPGTFELALAEQLAAAATEGVLEPAFRSLPRVQSAEPTLSDSPETHGAETQDYGEIVDSAGETIAEALENQSPFGSETRVRIGANSCIRDSSLNIEDWATEDGLTGTIPDLRRSLYGELDRIDPDVMKDLAKAYIHFGFGLEARSILAMDSKAPDKTLSAMARIVDGGFDQAGVFADQTDCDGRAAMWAMLAAAALPVSAQIDDIAILRSFEELPLHLRKLLGPKLATRLAEEGKPKTARDVLLRLRRATGDVSTEEMDFSEAKIDRLEGALHEAKAILDDIATGRSKNGPEALIALIELAAQEDATVPEDMLELAAAYTTELRETEQGSDLWLAHLRALISNDRFDEAFSELKTETSGLEESLAIGRSELFLATARRGEDITFLRHSVAATADQKENMPERVLRAVAERLLDLGLPQEAAKWVSVDRGETASREWRILNARNLLAEFKPEEAEIALIGLDGEDVLGLRAEARWLMGDYDYVKTVQAELGNDRGARDAAWLAGDWQSVALSDDDPLSAAASLVRTDQPKHTDEGPSLQLAESLALESARLRETLNTLLVHTQLAAD